MHTSPSILQTIRDHGAETYPEECCGMLIGHVTRQGNVVEKTVPVDNDRASNRERRYAISPETYRRAEIAARDEALEVVGFYHSHPDHPAQPSKTDLAEATFPGFTYVILSVHRGQPDELTAWSLAPDRSNFDRESIHLEPANPYTP